MKCKYMFLFLVKKVTRKGLIGRRAVMGPYHHDRYHSGLVVSVPLAY